MTSYDFTVPLVRALADLGVRHACVTPGSRNAPLLLTLDAEARVTAWSHLDERSAAFFAIGVAAVTDTPVLLACTSGTAAAEFFPAVIEARYGRVPLIVLTADRPAALRGTGAPQTIDQAGLYGSAVGFSLDLDASTASEPGAVAARLWSAATSPVSGPAHLNLQFPEPLMPPDTGLPDVDPDPAVPRVADPVPSDDDLDRLAGLCSGRRGVIVAGPNRDRGLAAAVTAAAAVLDWPVIADPLSGLRAGPHDRSRILAGGDLLAGAGWMERTPPEAVVRVGALPTSKPLWSWLDRSHRVPLVLLDPVGWTDPSERIELTVGAAASRTLAALAARDPEPAGPGWSEKWSNADAAVRGAAAAAVEAFGFPSEPGVAAAVADALTDGSVLWVASSMPVRDVDLTFGCTGRRIEVLANRGANGIDGFLSAGLGSAAVAGPSVLLAGDLSVIHDLGGLVAAARLDIPATIVAVNNDGGGIFHFLPQSADDPERFERLFGTPHGRSLVEAASGLGVDAERIDDRPTLMRRVSEQGPGPRLLEVVTDRRENAALHGAIRDAAAEALAAV